MKKNHRLYAIPLLALALAACTNDGLQDNPLADGPVPLSVTADISAVATRVNIADGSAASFTSGDFIHVVASGRYQHDYELQTDGTWKAGDPYYFQNTSSVSFQAWYASPHAMVVNNTIDVKTAALPPSDQTGKWDILATPQVPANVSSSSVSFTGTNAFAHVMTQLVFVFKAGTDDGVSDLTRLTGYKLCSVITDATFNTLSCTITPGTTTSDITVTGINDAAGKQQYEAAPLIVVPQTPSGGITLEVYFDGNTYRASLTPPTGGWQGGYSYTYTVTTKNTALEVSNAEISGWKTDANFNGNVDASLQ